MFNRYNINSVFENENVFQIINNVNDLSDWQVNSYEIGIVLHTERNVRDCIPSGDIYDTQIHLSYY
jgi:hypothetical protein